MIAVFKVPTLSSQQIALKTFMHQYIFCLLSVIRTNKQTQPFFCKITKKTMMQTVMQFPAVVQQVFFVLETAIRHYSIFHPHLHDRKDNNIQEAQLWLKNDNPIKKWGGKEHKNSHSWTSVVVKTFTIVCFLLWYALRLFNELFGKSEAISSK